MRFWILFAVVLTITLLSCGNKGDNYGYHYQTPTSPLDAALGTAVRFNILEVGFYISHYSEGKALVNITNYDSLPVRVVIRSTDGAIIIKNDSLVNTTFIDETLPFASGQSYECEAGVWKLGKDPKNCPGFDQGCFYEIGQRTINF